MKGDRHRPSAGLALPAPLGLALQPSKQPRWGHSCPSLPGGHNSPEETSPTQTRTCWWLPPPTPDCLSSQVSTLTVCEQITPRCGEDAALLSYQARLCTWMWVDRLKCGGGPTRVGSTGLWHVARPIPQPVPQGPLQFPPQEADISGCHRGLERHGSPSHSSDKDLGHPERDRASGAADPLQGQGHRVAKGIPLGAASL